MLSQFISPGRDCSVSRRFFFWFLHRIFPHRCWNSRYVPSLRSPSLHPSPTRSALSTSVVIHPTFFFF